MNEVKYYIYISDTKVDMLFAQIPQSQLSRLAVELEIDLQLFRTTLKEKERQDEATRYSKLEVVLNYLRKHHRIGAVESSYRYFAGELDMRWGEFPDTGFVYFTGRNDDAILGLGGSLKHVIGNDAMPALTSPGRSRVEGIERSLVSELGLRPLVDDLQRDTADDTPPLSAAGREGVLAAVENAATWMRGGTSDRVEFVARRLREDKAGVPRVVLGSPLYVAYVD